MPSFSKVILAGHLVKDPEVRFVKSGIAVSSPTIGVNYTYKKDGNKVEEVSFVDLELWGKTAEILEKYCKKGDAILVDGRIRQNRWEKDGQKHSRIVVVVDSLQMLGGKKDRAGTTDQAAAAGAAEATIEDPFAEEPSQYPGSGFGF